MTFLEPIIAAAVGAIAVAGFNKLSTLRALGTALKYGPLLKRIFDILDPALIMYMNKWSGSETAQAIRLAVEAVGDGKLTGGEIAYVAGKVAELWLPDKAAAKYADFKAAAETPTGLTVSKFFEEHINGGLPKKDAVSLIRSYLPK
jgi:hypothetical protein